MADRNVTVRLRAETSDFKRGMDQAAKSTEQVGKSAQDAGTKAAEAAARSRKEWTQWWPEVDKGRGVIGGLTDSIRANRESWTTAGTALGAYGVAVTGVTAAVLKTGIAYNTLQQTSRAALTTLLGGAQAANAQMDKLDEFARSSPFAKQVFIDAQRQLIGFGMEAEKVVPTLDAIQNAVAATGGSNQDIADLVRIIAQVGAAGKITATDLMQFGDRGVDAAKLIGSQMGKTGAQIREEITKGTLGADEAIEALTAGMQEQFGGAAENVKKTFSGAVDRVRGAIRDLSSDWAAWLVDPNAASGGAAVTGLNKIADVLRSFRNLPDPIKNVTGAMLGLSGVAATTASAFLLLAPRALDAYEALQKLNQSGKVAAGLKWAGIAVGVTMVVTALGSLVGTAIPATVAVEDVTAALLAMQRTDASSGIENVNELFRELSNQEIPRWIVGDLAVRIDDISAALNRIDSRGFRDWVVDLKGIMPGVTSEIDQTRAVFERLGESMARTAQEGNAELAAKQFQALVDELGGGEEVVQRLLAVMPAYASHLKDIENKAEAAGMSTEEYMRSQGMLADTSESLEDVLSDVAVAMDRQSGAADGLGEAHLELANAIMESHQANLAASNSAIAYEAALAKANESIKDNGKNLDIATEKGRENQSALNNIASAALKLAEDNAKAGASTADLSREMARARTDFIEVAKRMGMSSTEANRLADEFGLTTSNAHALRQSIQDVPSYKRTVLEAHTAGAIANVDELRRRIEGLSNRTITIGANVVLRAGQIGLNASGGVWDKAGALGLVRAYRSGGFFDGQIGAQQPQVRPYSGPRGLLWGEEGSGPWEAFISGHPAKRDRSLRVWLDVGRRLGAIAAHADGGMQEYARAARHADPVTRPVGATGGGTMRIEGVVDVGGGIMGKLVGTAEMVDDFARNAPMRSRMAGGVR